MSLTSLADAPLLSKPAGGADICISLPRSRSCPVTKLKEDQAAIDALFHEDIGMKVEKTHAERKNIPPTREPPSSARKFELKSNSGEAVALPALLPLSQLTGDFSKKRQPKQDDYLLSKTRDASAVLAGFLADNSIDINVNKPSLLEDVTKDQREDFKSKWNSYSPQPLGRLPTLTFSPRLASGSTLSTPDLSESSISPTKITSDNLSSLKKDEKWAAREDVLFLLPDESNRSGNEAAISESNAPTSCQNWGDEENSDFGGYQPSCLSMPAPTHAIQRRQLTSFFSPSETFNEKETKMGVREKPEKGSAPSVMVDNLSDQIEMLKNMHTMELERRDKQLCMERELVAEKKGAMESFSQLLLKADEWSAKIDELHKSIVCEKAAQPSERLNWIAHIESTVSEHESALQIMEKRSTEVCNQLEKVAIMIDNARKDMEILQKQEEQCVSSSHDQLQAFQDLIQRERGQALDAPTTPIEKSIEKEEEIHDPCLLEEQIWLCRFLEEKKDLELEREKVLCMKEQISQADATLRKQLHEHAAHMQIEAEEMARQKRELEHAKTIAAEIALEVEDSRRELEMYKTTLNKTIPEGPPMEDSLTTSLAPQRLPKFGRKSELSRRYELHRRPYSSTDVHRNSFYGMHLLETSKSLQSEDDMIQEVQEGMYYLRSQEEFLIQAEKALEVL